MQNLMTRRFTTREKVLLLILIVILLVGLYFFLVYYPIERQLNDIEEQKQEILEKQDVANIREAKYDSMKAELEEIFAKPEDEITTMPEYDNFQELMRKFNVIFEGTEPQLTFSHEQRSDSGVVSRPIQFRFNAENYDKAKSVIRALTTTGYRCLMTNLTVSPASGDVESDALTISGTITFYEIDK